MDAFGFYGFFLFLIMKEVFKDIPNYNGIYQVSNFGNVKSLMYSSERILKSYVQQSGYLKVNLFKNKKSKSFEIHQLVAMAFLNHKPNYFEKVVDHKNGIRSDNNLENLQIITQRENSSKDKKGFSKYVGVYLNKTKKRWAAYIRINGNKVFLGLFIDEKEAGKMYDKALENIGKYNGDNNEFRNLLR